MDADCPTPVPLPAGSATDRPAAAARGNPGAYDLYHAILLVISAGILVTACILQVRPDQRIAVSFLPAWPLPEVCQSKVVLGLECPGCGLTRSFVHLAHGDLPASLAVHPIGWLIALFVALQIPYRMVALRTRTSAPVGERIPWIVTTALFILLLAVWIVRLTT